MSSRSGATDRYLEHLTAARDVPAVIKADFASIAAALPDGIFIFAFEGSDDKNVYSNWIRGLKPRLKYEPFICKSKVKVLQLYDQLKLDLGGMGDRVYYFIDRDFDELMGREESERIFVTRTYSIENYLVCDDILDELLKIDFHCDGRPDVREGVKTLFRHVYSEFLAATKELNFQIFAARKMAIRQLHELPLRINQLAIVDVESAKAATMDAPRRYFERELTEVEEVRMRREFEDIVPERGYRGKFALVFFVKWLTELRAHRLSEAAKHFDPLPVPDYAVPGGFSLATLAPKAPPPDHLGPFLERI